MGRSVSTPYGAVAVGFVDVSEFGRVVDEDGNVTDEYCEWQSSDDWEWFTYDVAFRAKKKWKSFGECEYWVGREDKAILENEFAYVGVSEYCGCAAVWLLPKDEHQLAEAWCNKIAKNFEKEFAAMVKVGTFSNGEAVYKKVA
jgi:hypothetical protein